MNVATAPCISSGAWVVRNNALGFTSSNKPSTAFTFLCRAHRTTPLAFFTFYLDVMKLGSIFPFGSSNKSESVAQPDKKLPPGFKAGRRGSSDDGIRRSRASVSPRSVDDMVMFTGRGPMVPSAEAQANQVAALSLLESKDYLCGQR
jgi:hypothetical protein